MLSQNDLLKLPRAEKLRVMELLWADLSSPEEKCDSPEWHSQQLVATSARVDSGKEEPIDWLEAKELLRSGR